MREPVAVWFKQRVSEADVRGKRVLEVGSRNINGGLCGLLTDWGADYLGTDAVAGDGVDQVVRAEDLVATFGEETFDLVVSTETAEHFEHWRPCFSNMKRVLKTGGLLYITTVTPGFAKHDCPGDYWRFTPEHFQAIFADLEIIELADWANCAYGLFLLARKPQDFHEVDLSSIAVTPVS